MAPQRGTVDKAWLVLVGTALVTLASANNSTSITTALPVIRDDFVIPSTTLHWVLNAYFLASASTILLAGKLADRIGPVKASLIGTALYAVASGWVALAPNTALILLARAAQGIAVGAMAAANLAALNNSYPEQRRSAVVAIWGGLVVLGFSTGPFIGGVLTHYMGWRFLFWLNVPFAVIVLLCLTFPARDEPWQLREKAAGRTDYEGILALVVFMVSFTFALQEVRNRDASPILLFGLLGAALVTLIIFVALEQSLSQASADMRQRQPLVDLSIFRQRRFLGGTVAVFLSTFQIVAIVFYYNLYVQSSTGPSYSAIVAGLSLLPFSVAVLIVSLSAARLSARFGTRAVITVAMLLAALGSATLSMNSGALDYVNVALGLLVCGVGLGLIYSVAPRVSLRILPDAKAGLGSGTINTCSFLGGSVGVTVWGVCFAVASFAGVMIMTAGVGLLGAVLSYWLLRDDPSPST